MVRIKALKSKEDAFGQMIWALYKGREVFEVWEKSDGYIFVDFPKTYFSGYEDWAPHQKKAMEFVNGRVLDVGCGAGRHSLYLQKKGFDVFFYVLEGKGNVVVGDEKEEVVRNMLIESPKGIPHLLENTGVGYFKFLVIKLPKTK